MDSKLDRPEADLDPPTRGDLLERLPVTLTVSLGEVEVSAADVAQLIRGAVVTLDRPIGDPVDLRAGSRRIARGELVTVEGNLGVRITEVLL